MSLSKLSAKCQACPFIDTCDHKEMEALEFLSPLTTDTELSSKGQAMASGAVRIDVDELVRAIAREVQLPKRILLLPDSAYLRIENCLT